MGCHAQWKVQHLVFVLQANITLLGGERIRSFFLFSNHCRVDICLVPGGKGTLSRVLDEVREEPAAVDIDPQICERPLSEGGGGQSCVLRKSLFVCFQYLFNLRTGEQTP